MVSSTGFKWFCINLCIKNPSKINSKFADMPLWKYANIWSAKENQGTLPIYEELLFLIENNNYEQNNTK